MFTATITGVRDGDTFTRELEHSSGDVLYAEVVGTVQGMLASGRKVTVVEIYKDGVAL